MKSLSANNFPIKEFQSVYGKNMCNFGPASPIYWNHDHQSNNHMLHCPEILVYSDVNV